MNGTPPVPPQKTMNMSKVTGGHDDWIAVKVAADRIRAKHSGYDCEDFRPVKRTSPNYGERISCETCGLVLMRTGTQL